MRGQLRSFCIISSKIGINLLMILSTVAVKDVLDFVCVTYKLQTPETSTELIIICHTYGNLELFMC